MPTTSGKRPAAEAHWKNVPSAGVKLKAVKMRQAQKTESAVGSCREPRVLLHIGLPKTGTTSLQNLLFDRHPGIHYFGQSNVWTNPEAKTVLKALLVDDSNNETTARAHVAQGVDQGMPVVISDEALTFGEFMLRAQLWPIDSTPEVVAARTRRVLGRTRILIVLRNQMHWLVSWHRQGLKTGKYTETKFENWLERDLGSEQTDRLFELLDYDRLVAAFIDQFGADYVNVRFYENFRKEFPRLAASIAEMLGIIETKAYDLLADYPAANVTPHVFRTLPPELHRLARTEAGRAALDLMPKRYRVVLRDLFVRDRACESLEHTTMDLIRKQFMVSNSALRNRLGFEKVPNCYA